MQAGFAPILAGSTLPLAASGPRGGTAVELAEGTAHRWARELARLARVGFDAVDIVDTFVPFGELDDAAASVLARAVGEARLAIAGLSSIRRSIIDPADGEHNLRYTHRAIDVAAAIGAPVLSIGFHRPLTAAQQAWERFWEAPSPVDLPESFELAVTRLRELARHAEQAGMTLSLELYEHTFVGTGRGAAQLVETVGSSCLGINADLANLHRAPEPLAEGWVDTLTAVLPYMNYWHVKNYRRAAVYPDGPHLAWPTPLADGDIDYRRALALASAAGYAGPVCIEHYGGDGLTAQAEGLRYLTTLLEQL